MFRRVLLCPLVLLGQSTRLYIGGCITAYFAKAYDSLWGLFGKPFKDKQFPATKQSIGHLKNKTDEQLTAELEWKRLADIFTLARSERTQLFTGKVEPNDICQGALGNCWLLSALQCLAKEHGLIQSLFLTKQYNKVGRYKVRLFDQTTESWVILTVDDWIPCSRRLKKPMFTQPNGNEGWVLILEKAFAKLKGSYAALDGGVTAWGLETLTGDQCYKYIWQQTEMKFDKRTVFQQNKKDQPGVHGVFLQSVGEKVTQDGMFEILLYTSRRGALLAASTGNGNDTQSTKGIVHGHAYAILSVRLIDKVRLIQLRNPWGKFEWTGDWSDHSALWQTHPKIERAVKLAKLDDGAFWMAWKDFCQHFHSIDVCERTRGFDDIVLNVHEEFGCAGPCIGCLEGCATFWCCCVGARAYMGYDPSKHYAIRPVGTDDTKAQEGSMDLFCTKSWVAV